MSGNIGYVQVTDEVSDNSWRLPAMRWKAEADALSFL
jgi:hypothetical protein